MARLTRTQKYAELRSQLENAREQELKTVELNKYEEKLDQLKIDKDHFAKDTSHENEPITLNDLSSILDNSLNAAVSKLNIEKEEEVLEEPSVEEVIKPVLEPVSPVEEEKVLNEVLTEETEEETLEETGFEAFDDFMPFDFLEAEDTKTEVVEEANNDQEEIVEEAPIIDTEYLDSTLNEVNEYNKAKGLITASEMPEVLVNEIRQSSKTIEEIEEEVDDLSNTVTMEIKKILNALDDEEIIDEEPEVVSEVKEEATEETPLVQAEELSEDVAALLKTYINGDDTSLEETIVAKSETTHSLDEELLKTKEENKQEDSHLLNETIPFEFTATQPVSTVKEEEEVGQPNKVLNVILIILIVILLAILLFIGYLILVAQGII